MNFNSVVVFCASSLGNSSIYQEQASLVGHTLAQKRITLVYGGGRAGLMGAVADGALASGGKVVGVIPHFLNSKEREHTGVTELIVVDSMHERKRIMHERAEAIIALPGGFGTMEELFEMTTWAQIGLHQKPIGILNTKGYYNYLIAFMDQMVKEGLLRKENRDMLLVSDNIEGLLNLMDNYDAPPTPKWIKSEDNSSGDSNADIF